MYSTLKYILAQQYTHHSNQYITTWCGIDTIMRVAVECLEKRADIITQTSVHRIKDGKMVYRPATIR